MSVVSVVLASYNGEKFIGEQLQSILSQTEERLEVIVRDDASTDDTQRIAAQYASRDRRVQVCAGKTRLGIKGNFLEALAKASGDFVAFSDQDDWWYPTKIEVQKKLLQTNPDRQLAYSDLEVCDGKLNVQSSSFWKQAGIRPRSGRLGSKTLLRNLAPGCSMMIRKGLGALMRQVPENAEFMHDHLAFVLASLTGGVVYTQQPLVKYRQHSQNSIGAGESGPFDRAKFLEELKIKSDALRRVVPSASKELDDLDYFLRHWDTRSHADLARAFPFLLFMRKDAWKDRILGVFEGLLPVAYKNLQKYMKRI
jgi:glycosyltransferase involved in cell wall biosynthesis